MRWSTSSLRSLAVLTVLLCGCHRPGLNVDAWERMMDVNEKEQRALDRTPHVLTMSADAAFRMGYRACLSDDIKSALAKAAEYQLDDGVILCRFAEQLEHGREH